MKYSARSASILAVLAGLSATPVMGEQPNDLSGPTVKCRDGARFGYKLNNMTSFLQAKAKCVSHGGIDEGPAKIAPKLTGPRVKS